MLHLSPHKALLLAAVVMAMLAVVSSAHAQLQITSPDGQTSIKFGILSQIQAEGLTTPDGKNMSTDIYIRRFRIILGGNIMKDLSFFVETDNPLLGKVGNSTTGEKGASYTYLQDAFMTYSFSDEFMIDAGMLLMPVSHNSEQSAASLLGIDYGPYTFIWSVPTQSRVGRDYGVEARGFLGDNHFEYRAGLFQGLRGVNSLNPERITARVVWYPFQNEPGYFYAGTYMGARKILGIGVSLDHQSGYTAYGADLFYDYPLDNKDVPTVQVDYTNYDGGTFLPAIAKQSVIFAEAAYYFHDISFAPFVQANYDNFSNSIPGRIGLASQHFIQGGLAYYVKGQNFNIKLGVGQFGGDGFTNQTQILLRLQAFTF
ncbi:MAG: OprO/OprP family phosphate-selective porin [Bacteroidetes bacterium]|nr:OprO/OprP family phosphate-selective porin [Bacteroidota bacterium]MCL5738696.1 OprO/OprP family phosphate-selective porin [Bacteroidota bacterium]